MNRHNRIYMVLLNAMAFFYALGTISIAFVGRAPTMSDESRWVFQMTACINGMFVGAMVATLILRGVASGAGRIATKALNIVLLIAFPLGTALGIYGLLKVDKEAGRVGA